MGPYESMADVVRRQLRLQELCEIGEVETDFDRLAQIVEEVLSLLTEQETEDAQTRGDPREPKIR